MTPRGSRRRSMSSFGMVGSCSKSDGIEASITAAVDAGEAGLYVGATMTETPQEFFEQWLPAQFRNLRAGAGAAAPPDITIGVSLLGDGGGDWTLAVRGGELAVTPKAA